MPRKVQVTKQVIEVHTDHMHPYWADEHSSEPNTLRVTVLGKDYPVTDMLPPAAAETLEGLLDDVLAFAIADAGGEILELAKAPEDNLR